MSTNRTHTTAARTALALLAGGALLLAVAPIALADAPQLAHLRAYFPGDGTAKDVVNDVAGTPEDGATLTAGGEVGQAFSLDGSGDAFEFGANGWQLPAADFSVVGWVKTSQATGSEIVIEEYECAGFCPGNDASSMWRVGIVDGKAIGIVRENGVPGNGLEVVGGSVADGTWHHVAFVRDTGASKAFLYVDGALSASSDLNSESDGALASADGEDDPVVIGAHILGGTGSLEQFFSGSIDEIGFYDVALSSADVAAIEALGRAGLRLDDTGAGATAAPSVAASAAPSTNPSSTASEAPPAGTAHPTLPNTSTSPDLGTAAGAGPGGMLVVLLGLAVAIVVGAGVLVGRVHRKAQG